MNLNNDFFLLYFPYLIKKINNEFSLLQNKKGLFYIKKYI